MTSVYQRQVFTNDKSICYQWNVIPWEYWYFLLKSKVTSHNDELLKASTRLPRVASRRLVPSELSPFQSLFYCERRAHTPHVHAPFGHDLLFSRNAWRNAGEMLPTPGPVRVLV